MVELALSAAESSSFKVNEAEIFNQRVRNLIEVPHEAGVQISKSFVNSEKQKSQEANLSDLMVQ